MEDIKNLYNLCDILNKKLFASTNKAFCKKVEDLLINDKYFSAKEYFQLGVSKNSLYSLVDTPHKLFWICNAMYKASNGKISLLKFFTDAEIEQYKKIKTKHIDINVFRYFDGTYVLEENRQWVCRASIKQLAILFQNNIIQFNSAFSRQDEKQLVSKQVFFNKRVKEIKDLLVSGEYYLDAISLNLINRLQDVSPTNNKGLVGIPVGEDCLVIDGHKRLQACLLAYVENPQLEEYFENIYFPIVFTYLSKKMLKNLLSQKWTAEPINKCSKDYMKISYANTVVNEVMSSERADVLYSNKIVKHSLSKSLNDGLIVYSNMLDAINRNYDTESMTSQAEALALADWIIEFYNEVARIFHADFADINASRKIRWVADQYAVYGFIALSKILKDNPNWKEELFRVTNEIDWEKEQSPIVLGNTYKNIKPVEDTFFAKVGK